MTTATSHSDRGNGITLSMAICTYNRPSDLVACLQAMGDLGYHRTHEVIVVDNSDDPLHRDANEKTTQSWPGVRYLVSEPPGLSRARNVALAAAFGEVIAYLDDDATCCDGWAEAVVGGFAHRDVVCVGGPIVPVWKERKPDWLGGELLFSLAIMDLGRVARDLAESEFFFGANVAFRRAALQAAGGFDEQLGRTKTDLMGNEEIDAQRRTRKSGRLRYAPDAKVRHHIQAERCSWQWFLKRYAWQGVSDARSSDAGTLAYLATLLQQKDMPGAADFAHELFATEPRSVEQAMARVQFVRGMVAALLNNDVPTPRKVTAASKRRALEAPEFELFKCQVPGDTDYLFLEFGLSHAFLFGAYGEIRDSSLLNPKLEPTQQRTECVEFFRNAVHYADCAGVKAVILLTADVLTWPGYEHALDDLEVDVALFGFLHRVPGNADDGENLRRLSHKADGLFVFSTAVKNYIETQYKLSNIVLTNIPPVFMGNAPVRNPRMLPSRRSGGPQQVGLGMLGEIRPGKGYEFVIDALAAAPLTVRSTVKVVMAGAVDEAAERRIRTTCADASLVHELQLRQRGARGYRAIPDNLFVQALLATDVIVLPYEGDHRNAISGHFVDALRAGSWFLATRNTVMGDLVDEYQLGETFEPGDRRSCIAALESLLERIRSDSPPNPLRLRLADAHSTANACREIEEALHQAMVGRGKDAWPAIEDTASLTTQLTRP